MSQVFLTVLNMSLAASAVAIVLLFLRLALKKRLPRLFFYVLWLLVLARLLLPAALPSPLSFYRLAGAEAVVARSSTSTLRFVEDHGVAVDFPVRAPSPEAPAPESPPVAWGRVELLRIASTVWLCGMAALLIYGLLCYVLTARRLRFAVRLRCPQVEAARRRAGLDRDVEVFVSDMLDSPIVCGVLAPRILLPQDFDTGDSAALEHILAHELTHIRRGDNLIRLAASLAVALHWFNPLVWFCFSRAICDMEASCDQRVLSRESRDIRGEYASLLLRLAAHQKSAFSGGFTSFGESAVKERIRSIMNFKKSTVIAILLCGAAAVGLAIVFLTNPPPAAQTILPASESDSQEPSSVESSIPSVLVPPPESDSPAPPPPSSQPQPPPAPTPAAVSVSQEEETPRPSTITALNPDDIATLYVLDNGAYTYHAVTEKADREALVNVVNTLSVDKGKKPDKEDAVPRSFLVKLKNGEKFDYEVSETQIVCGDQKLQSTDPQRKLLRTLIQEGVSKYVGAPQWIAYMNSARMVGLEYFGVNADGTETAALTTENAEAVTAASTALKALTIIPGSTKVLQQDNGGTLIGHQTFNISFDSGTIYYIEARGDHLVIRPSDRTWSVRYQIPAAQMETLAKTMTELVKTTDGGQVTTTTTTPSSADSEN